MPTKLISIIFLFLLLIFSEFSYKSQENLTPNIPGKTPENFLNDVRVIDGDTIELEDGQKVRLIGIDSPETYGKTECFGDESKKFVEKIFEQGEVSLEKDVSETDKYGRLLRYVYLDGKFINDEIVRQGFAKVSTYPPDIKYQDIFIESEKFARENKLGLWSKCF